MAAAGVLDASEDFPGWLRTRGVNANVARAIESELGIPDTSVLRACIGDDRIRAELLAAARDRLPFGFYAVLRQVVRTLRPCAPSGDGGGGGGADAVRDLADVLATLFSGLCRELTVTARRLGSIEGRGGGRPAERDRPAEILRDYASHDIADGFSSAGAQASVHGLEFEDDMTLPSDELGEPTDSSSAHGPAWRAIKTEHDDACSGVELAGHSDFFIQEVTSLQSATKRPLRAARIKSYIRLQQLQQQQLLLQQQQQQLQQSYEGAGNNATGSSVSAASGVFLSPPPPCPVQPRGQWGAPTRRCAAPQQLQLNRGTASAAAAAAGAAAAAAGPKKPFECRQCGRQFAKSIYLTVHMRIHTGEKPHRCDVCGQAFSQYSTWKRHLRTHTGEKPYRCDVCGRAFSHYTSLTSHVRRHTGEKPYRCDVCGRAFSQGSSMKTHMRTHLGKKT